MTIPMVPANDGEYYPSRLFSYLFWKRETNNFSTVPIRKNGHYIGKYTYLLQQGLNQCPVCKEEDNCRYPGNRSFWCICETLHAEYEHAILHKSIQSNHRNKAIEDLVPHGNPQGKELIRKIKQYFKAWMQFPNEWVILHGSVGTGKTHVLESLTSIGPIVLYITANDFEAGVFRNLDTNSLDEYISILSHAPILLIDDLGTAYGSDIVKQKMRYVINSRYVYPEILPTVISTNMSKRTLAMVDPRTADRLWEIARPFDFSVVDSYRKLIGDSLWNT